MSVATSSIDTVPPLLADALDLATNATATRAPPSPEVFWSDLHQLPFLAQVTAFYLALRVFIFPTTLIKTRQQAHKPAPNIASRAPSIFTVLQSTVKHSGPLGLYQAFYWNVLGLPIDPLYIAVLEITRESLSKYLNSPSSSSSAPKLSQTSQELLVTLSAGAAGALVQQTFQVPIDVVTQRLMVQQHPNISALAGASVHTAAAAASPVMNARGIIADIVRNDGLRGLYKGYLLTLSAVVPFSALQWTLYWKTQSILSTYLKMNPLPNSSEGHDYREVFTAPVSATIAATVSSVLTQPFDTIKTRLQLQTKRTPIKDTIKSLIQDQGIKGFMSGAGARVLTLTPSAIISMSFYEYCKRNNTKQRAELS